jgi:hypothetical protein
MIYLMEQTSINNKKHIVEVEGKYAYILENGQKKVISDMNEVMEKDLLSLPRTIISKEQSEKSPDAFILLPKILPSGRIPFNYESKVGNLESHRMSTTGAFDPKNGYITAETRTWTWTAFGGFTGGVKIAFYDQEGVIITYSQTHRFGVNGTWVPGGPSDRRDSWSENINLADAAKVQTATVIHCHDPKSIEEILERAKNNAKKLADITGEITNIASISQVFTKK